jgi:hypothetical protein
MNNVYISKLLVYKFVFVGSQVERNAILQIRICQWTKGHVYV